MRPDTITIYYAIGGVNVDVLRMQAWAVDPMPVGSATGLPLAKTALTSVETFNGTWDGAQIVFSSKNINFLGSQVNRQTYCIVLDFYTNGTAGDLRYIFPASLLQFTYTSISPWEYKAGV